MSDLYEDDILLWSEQQAEALRRRAANEIDWENVAEEIAAVRRSERNAVESHLVQALLHDLMAEGWPRSRDVPDWRAEALMPISPQPAIMAIIRGIFCMGDPGAVWAPIGWGLRRPPYHSRNDCRR
jgi:Domain of unknown function DUF29